MFFFAFAEIADVVSSFLWKTLVRKHPRENRRSREELSSERVKCILSLCGNITDRRVWRINLKYRIHILENTSYYVFKEHENTLHHMWKQAVCSIQKRNWSRGLRKWTVRWCILMMLYRYWMRRADGMQGWGKRETRRSKVRWE